MQKIVLLGATGSIGDQTLDIIRRYPDQFKIVGMSANKNAGKLTEIANEFEIKSLYLASGTVDKRAVNKLTSLVTEDIDHLIVADHGLGCFETVLKALSMGKRVSVANKELIIAHGQDIVYLAREQQAELIPLDSEHNALFQCLRGEKISDVRRLIITASGGPFRDRSFDDLSGVTAEQVLNHPNWSMGAKTTVDSATLVNKAFEVIETHHLFGIPYEKIEVRLHPESIVHAIVEFNDGSSKMLAYRPDMRFAIGYALFYPDRAPESLTGADNYFEYDRDLHFSRIEEGRFPCFDFVLDTARERPESLRQLLKNDEEAVDGFLTDNIDFTMILSQLKKEL